MCSYSNKNVFIIINNFYNLFSNNIKHVLLPRGNAFGNVIKMAYCR